MVDLAVHIQAFLNTVARGDVEIYNEFSLQHELGVFLRSRLRPTYTVEFERPSTHFGIRDRLTKREIDIAVLRPDHSEVYALELKFPRSGQHPEQMFKFVEDVAFVEDLCEHGFQGGAVLVVVDDPLFHASGSTEGIYGYFRGNRPLAGEVSKPTGQRDKIIQIRGSYSIEWTQVVDRVHAALIEIGGHPTKAVPSARSSSPEQSRLAVSAALRSPQVRVSGKYAALTEFLRNDGRDRVELSFARVDAIVGGLPRSAHDHKAWWGNQSSSVQGQAWQSAGYRVDMADLVGKRVRFVRAR